MKYLKYVFAVLVVLAMLASLGCSTKEQRDYKLALDNMKLEVANPGEKYEDVMGEYVAAAIQYATNEPRRTEVKRDIADMCGKDRTLVEKYNFEAAFELLQQPEK